MLAAAALAGCGGAAGVPARAIAPVTDVVDGDTIRVRLDGRAEVVRVIGIDTPEPYREGAPQPCSRAASARMRELARDRVALVAGAEERDRYGRLLRYVERDGADLGAQLVREGLARPLRVQPNTARADRYEALADAARRRRLGIWGGSCAIRKG